MPQLHETRMGQRLIEGTLPKIADALEALVKELKRTNDLKEQTQKEQERWCNCEDGVPYSHDGKCPKCGKEVPKY